MHYRIANTFIDSLARLTGAEQKAVKTKAFELQLRPNNPSMRFHRLGAAKDPNFWSVRINRDIRLIVHRSASSLLLCYVDHHDKGPISGPSAEDLKHIPKRVPLNLSNCARAYGKSWFRAMASRTTQFPPYAVKDEPVTAKPALLKNISGDDLLRFGVPADWP